MTTPGSQVDVYQPVIGLVITVCGEMGRLGSEIASFLFFGCHDCKDCSFLLFVWSIGFVLMELEEI